MTGQVPDAGPYIERMDVLVNASDPEPFGIVLLEGMARGVPVLAVNSGGPAEFIEIAVTIPNGVARTVRHRLNALGLNGLVALNEQISRGTRGIVDGHGWCGAYALQRHSSRNSYMQTGLCRMQTESLVGSFPARRETVFGDQRQKAPNCL